MKTKKLKKQLIIAGFLWLLMIGVTFFILNYKSSDLYDSNLTRLGKNIFILAFMLLLGFYMLHFKPHVFLDTKQMLLFAIIYLLMIVPSLLLVELEVLWLIPFTLFGMIVAIMLDEILGIMANVVITLIVAIVGNLSLSFILFFVISGSVAPILVMKAKERENMLYIALYLMALNGALTIISSLFNSYNSLSVSIPALIYVMIHGGLSVVLTYGSLPLWESLFGIMTPFKLMELSNSNQKLLQKLMNEAPGTYHHVQLVSNLSEAAAAAIGANPLLAKAAALYHDVGKLKNPEYFIENQNGENPHDGLSPDASVGIIIGHVAEGVRILKDFHLPKSIIEIAEQHHGKSLVQYFYQKAIEHSDGFAINRSDFCYVGPKPKTLEAAVVMLADICEAAIRAGKLEDMEQIQALIQKMIHSRVEDGQLSDSDLKLKDLILIENAFVKVYNGMYHERIKYKEN